MSTMGWPVPPVSQYQSRVSGTTATPSLAGTCGGIGIGAIGSGRLVAATASPAPLASVAVPTPRSAVPISRPRRLNPSSAPFDALPSIVASLVADIEACRLRPDLLQIRHQPPDGVDHRGRRLVEIRDQPFEPRGCMIAHVELELLRLRNQLRVLGGFRE